jgi:hypothetical protein
VIDPYVVDMLKYLNRDRDARQRHNNKQHDACSSALQRARLIFKESDWLIESLTECDNLAVPLPGDDTHANIHDVKHNLFWDLVPILRSGYFLCMSSN